VPSSPGCLGEQVGAADVGHVADGGLGHDDLGPLGDHADAAVGGDPDAAPITSPSISATYGLG